MPFDADLVSEETVIPGLIQDQAQQSPRLWLPDQDRDEGVSIGLRKLSGLKHLASVEVFAAHIWAIHVIMAQDPPAL